MRTELKKLLFFGPKEYRSHFLQMCRDESEVEFAGAAKALAHRMLPEDAGLLSEALSILQHYQEHSLKEMNHHLEEISAIEHAEQIVKLHEKRIYLEQAVKNLKKEIEQVEFIGNVSLQDVAYISHACRKPISFYVCDSCEGPQPKSEEDYVIYVQEHLDKFVFMVIGEYSFSFKGGFAFFPRLSLKDLFQEVVSKEKEIEAIKKELKRRASIAFLLRKAFAEKVDKHRLQTVKSTATLHLDNKYFALEGWVPQTQLEQVCKIAQKSTVFVEELKIDASEKVPTYLNNKKLAGIGQDLVVLYDVPSPKEKDPSKWVLGSFVCFFSMIVGDAGYGLIFLLAAGVGFFGFRSKKKKLSSSGKRLFALTTILGLACVIWGVASSSFFGLRISPRSYWQKVSCIHFLLDKKANYLVKEKPQAYKELIKEHSVLETAATGQTLYTGITKKNGSFPVYDMLSGQAAMELALFIGVIHLAIAFIRNIGTDIGGLGWVLFMLGAYLYFPVYLNTISLANYLFHLPIGICARWGIWMIYGGIGWSVLVGLIRKKIAGLADITVVIQVFSDVLSYVRLYALALAGGMMAQTFNDIAAALPMFFGVIVLILGHSINIVLGVMGGVIHGLRLNFIEWYHYGFEGGGRLFNPLKRVQIEE